MGMLFHNIRSSNKAVVVVAKATLTIILNATSLLGLIILRGDRHDPWNRIGIACWTWADIRSEHFHVTASAGGESPGSCHNGGACWVTQIA
jgi:hypothetical protein